MTLPDAVPPQAAAIQGLRIRIDDHLREAECYLKYTDPSGDVLEARISLDQASEFLQWLQLNKLKVPFNVTDVPK